MSSSSNNNDVGVDSKSEKYLERFESDEISEGNYPQNTNMNSDNSEKNRFDFFKKNEESKENQKNKKAVVNPLLANRSTQDKILEFLRIKKQLKISTEERFIYINQDLPNDMIDEKTNLPKTSYPRNKIRTTKYTPISFIPKNLIFQFTNIANSYFLLIIILGAFEIFGVSNPGFQAVPLVVIVCVTAIKDAFEDYSRANSDVELNNSKVHMLVGLHNPNVITDHVGPWRKFKKACTRGNRAVFRFLKKNVFRKDVSDTNIDSKPDNESILSNSTNFSNGDISLRRSVSTTRTRYGAKLSPFVPNTVVDPNIKPLMTSKFENRYWKDINVGDIIRIRENEESPADCIVLSTSDIEGNCHIETKNLDGETNLKSRSSLKCTMSLKHACDLERSKMMVNCEPPNPDLYKFKGILRYRAFADEQDSVGTDESEPVTNNNIILRGSSLRNTRWCMCLVISTGSETKIMLNSGITPTKKSRISQQLNLSVIINFCTLFVMCFVAGLVNGLFYDESDTSRVFFEYKAYASTPAANGVVSFFVALILYQTLVPISLYITIEIIKTLQAFFIYSDINMYYEKIDFPCTPKSWNISDDLGQIEYIFSDKTGTLTQNVMEFKKCTIGGKSYGLAFTEAHKGLLKRSGKNVAEEEEKMVELIKDDKEKMIQQLRTINNPDFDETKLTFISNEFVEDLLNNPNSSQAIDNERFMLALALCHTAITGKDNEGFPIFKAESPDEAALVAAANDIGITFKEKTRVGQVIKMFNSQKEDVYEILAVIPFNSSRKRMSIILRLPEDSPLLKNRNSNILLLSKGADNVIYERLSKSNNQSDLIGKTSSHLRDFANEGLRTLCVAEKELDSDEFNTWLEKYTAASNSIEESRDDDMERIADEIEQGLTLLGGTAIEDNLQEGVPRSIELLAKAGIKLWVLTGDKIETAINIGFSCNLLDPEMRLLTITAEPFISATGEAEKNATDKDDESERVNLDDAVEIRDDLTPGEQITKYLKDIYNLDGSKEELKIAKKDHSTPSSNNAIVIDGVSLNEVLNDSVLTRKLLLLCKNSRSVICCRVSPAQKALIVRMVKDNLDVMTLAVGDGANDVAMIQAANIGVGIAGEEGRQAVMSSDYAIAQFRFLVRLLLVHGRWSYKRLAETIPCFFYKNIVFVFALFWFGIFSNFDGSYLYEYTYLMFFNLAFTSLPVICVGVLDQDVSDTVSLLTPELYISGILGEEWSQFKFIYYMLDGLYQSVISFFFPWIIFRGGVFANQEGLPVDHRFWVGVYVATISVVACNIYVLLLQKRWDYVSLIIYAFSILVIFFWTGIWSSSLGSLEFYKSASQCYGSVSFWAVFFIGVLVCILPRLCYEILNRLYRPRDIDIIREKADNGDYNMYPQGYDPTDMEEVRMYFNAESEEVAEGESPYGIETHTSTQSATSIHSRVDQLQRVSV